MGFRVLGLGFRVGGYACKAYSTFRVDGAEEAHVGRVVKSYRLRNLFHFEERG